MNRYGKGINNPMYKHGMSNTPLYLVWVDMIRRCDNPNRIAYKDYGMRGIKVCPEWYNSAVFIDWALNNGYDKKLLLDRINNDGNYEPSNCRFVTRTISELNKRKRDDYDIFDKGNYFLVCAKRNSKRYYGGRTNDIIKARILRDNLIKKLNSGEYDPTKYTLIEECDIIKSQRDPKTGRYLPINYDRRARNE